MTLDLTDDQAVPVSAAASTQAGEERGRLAVIGDDRERARMLGEALRHDYEVRPILGQDAVADLRVDPPDLILADAASPTSANELMRQLREDPALSGVPVVVLLPGDDASGSGGIDVPQLHLRLSAAVARARHRSLDAAWRQALLSSLHDGVLIFDAAGEVIEMNQAFSEMFGYTLDDGPFTPPYPWWPTRDEDPDQRAAIALRHIQARAGVSGVSDALFFDQNRHPRWASIADAHVRDPDTGLTATIRTFRDITRQKEAQKRRAAAAEVSASFAGEDDIATLLGLAEHGFELLFEGLCTIQIDLGGPILFQQGAPVTEEDIQAQILAGLGGRPSADSISLRPGILLVPQTSTVGCRAWLQFPRRRQIGPDEMIVADLLAQAFALAVDRVVLAQQTADRQEHMARAIESHRLIGQAVGFLVERHHDTPSAAFERLKHASQRLNLKLRAVAEQVIETGVDPEAL